MTVMIWSLFMDRLTSNYRPTFPLLALALEQRKVST